MPGAGVQLNTVQPALSMQIAKLERNFGKQLFDRTAHGVSLTPAGETLGRLPGPIAKEVDRTREEMARLDGRIPGPLSSGMITSSPPTTLTAPSAQPAPHDPETH